MQCPVSPPATGNDTSSRFWQELEEKLADYCGVKHAISCSSGTDALLLSLRAMGIGPGDEVIVPNLTFASTASSVFHAGAHPVLCDIDPRTWCISPDSLRSVVTSRTKAIIPVHLYGQPVKNFDKLVQKLDQ